MYELDTNVNVSTLHDHLLPHTDPFTKKKLERQRALVDQDVYRTFIPLGVMLEGNMPYSKRHD